MNIIVVLNDLSYLVHISVIHPLPIERNIKERSSTGYFYKDSLKCLVCNTTKINFIGFLTKITGFSTAFEETAPDKIELRIMFV